MVRFFALWMGTVLQFCHAMIYTNDWAVRINEDLESVDRIAEKYGFTNMGQVSLIKHINKPLCQGHSISTRDLNCCQC